MLKEWTPIKFKQHLFKEKNLRGSDLSSRNLCGMDFSTHVLINANFSRAKTGISKPWVIILTVSLVILSSFSSVIIGFSSAFLSFAISEFSGTREIIFSAIVPVSLLITFILITLYRGLGLALGATGVVISAVIIIGIASKLKS